MRKRVVAILIGIIVSIAISCVILFVTPEGNAAWPLWYSGFRTISEAVQAVGPGFVAGWLAARNGLLIGACVGVGAELASLLFVALFWEPLPLSAAAVALAFGLVANVLTQSVAGLAGAYLRQQRLAGRSLDRRDVTE